MTVGELRRWPAARCRRPVPDPQQYGQPRRCHRCCGSLPLTRAGAVPAPARLPSPANTPNPGQFRCMQPRRRTGYAQREQLTGRAGTMITLPSYMKRR